MSPPPFASITAAHIRLIEWTSLAMSAWGMLFHAVIRFCSSCTKVVGGGCIFLTSSPIRLQTCLITFRSGECAGHGFITCTLWCWRKACVIPARSCWNMTGPFCCCKKVIRGDWYSLFTHLNKFFPMQNWLKVQYWVCLPVAWITSAHLWRIEWVSQFPCVKRTCNLKYRSISAQKSNGLIFITFW